MLAGIGAVLSGAAALGGLFGRKGSDAAKNRETRHNAEQERVLRNQLQWRAEDARKAGLHPVTALGTSVAGSAPFIPGQSETGSHWSEAAQGVGRAMSRFAERKQAKELHELQKEKLHAEVGETRARQGLFNAQAHDIAFKQAGNQGALATWVEGGRAGVNPSTGQAMGEGGAPFRVPSSRSNRMPFDVDPSKLSDEYVYYRRDDGSVGKTFNPDVVGEEVFSGPFLRYVLEELMDTDRRGYEKQRVRRGAPADRQSVPYRRRSGAPDPRLRVNPWEPGWR